ncbi:MAG: hypothetical protein AAF957_01560 [Planctomycetota bacterium]
MSLRLVAVIGVALAVLLLLRSAAGTGDVPDPPPLVEMIPATAVPAVDTPVRLEDVASRVLRPVDDRDAPASPSRSEDVPQPTPPTTVDDGHWIEGRALLTDGTPITGFRVKAFKPPAPDLSDREVRRYARGAAAWHPLASAEPDELGRFRIGPLSEGSYGIGLDPVFTVLVDAVTIVEAPTTAAELRVDGLLVVLEVPRDAVVRPRPSMSSEQLEITSTTGRRSARSGTVDFDENGRVERLLPCGVGHRFRFSSADGRHFEATLDEATLPGRHHLLLDEVPFVPGTVRAILGGDAGDPGLVVAVVVSPVPTKPEHATFSDRGVSLLLGNGVAEAENESFAAGDYLVRARLRPSGETDWYSMSVRPAEIEVRPGRVTEVRVDLVHGGRLSVSVDGGAGASDSRVWLEVYDADKDRWSVLRVHTAQDRTSSTRSTGAVSLEAPNRIERAFPPGPLRLRLRGDGWRTAEATVTIVEGHTTEWRPRPERD